MNLFLRHKFLVFLFGISFLLMALAYPAGLQAQEDPSLLDTTSAEQVFVSVYILRIGKLDISAGTYTIDFYLDMWCDPCGERFPAKFSIQNGTTNTKELIIDEPHWKSYRIQATLSNPLNLSDFPFDSHQLAIVITDDLYTSTQLTYVPSLENSGLDPQVFVPGWQIDPEWQAAVEHRYYPLWQAYWPIYTFEITLSKPISAGILKGIIPAVLIFLGSYCSLLISPDKAASRIPIVTATLIGSIVFHLNLTSVLPAVGYLTYADVFMIINYLGLVLLMLIATLTLRWHGRQNSWAEQLNQQALWAVPAGWLILQLGNIWVMLG